MHAGVLKASPLAAVIGGLSIRDIALYATVVSLLAGLLVIGAVWAAAKAWRERAEARTDEAHQLRQQLSALERDLRTEKEARHKQAEEIAALRAELRSRPDIRESQQQILAAITALADAFHAAATHTSVEPARAS